ncbi:MAG: hypothetical protein U0793_14015 [Gemmataceae bacterium]
MRTILTSLLALFILGLANLSATEPSNEIAAAKLPKKVSGILGVKYPGLELVKAFKDTEDGESFYSVVLKYNKREYEVTITGQGEILETAKTLTAKDLPEPVAKAIHAKYKGATVKEAAEVRQVGEKISRTFHVEIETGPGASVDLILDPQGKILEEEAGSAKK